MRKRSHFSFMVLRAYTWRPRGSRLILLEVQLPLSTPHSRDGQAGGGVMPAGFGKGRKGVTGGEGQEEW